ncbi:MAG: type II toxin-antitoxin system RelE/ParE family toxin [Hyphomicrobiales bacterium]|nr:type II toxin-antitoxin system RelE/ParE family toxin [Hyphomicrobiales bacterium]
MIVRGTASGLADLESIEDYLRREWPKPRAPFEARLTAIEQRIVMFPLSAPRIQQRPEVLVVAFVEFPYRLFYRIEGDSIGISGRPPYVAAINA